MGADGHLSMDEAIDADAVRTELERIANSETFARSNRMQELVRYLVHNELAGNGDRLRSFNIAIDVFGRDAEFDPNNDSIVRVEAARLRRMLSAHYIANPDSKLRISIPKGRYLPTYELIEETPAPAHAPLHSPIGGPGIAVLPFAGDASKQAQKEMCDGLTYELNFQLSRFAEFRVVDASSLADIPAAELLSEVANGLECQYLVKGQIASTSAGIRIHVQALDATNARVLWSERFDVELQDTGLLDLEEEIASSIARALAPAPGPLLLNGFDRGNPAPKDWEAIDCVLRWHHYRAHLRSPKIHADLTNALRRVLKKHPGFSLGWAISAYLTLDSFVYRLAPDIAPEIIQRNARTSAETALGLSQKNSIARYVLGLCDYFSGNRDGFRSNFQQALALNPNSLDMLHHGGTLLAFGGAWEEGKALVLEAGLSYLNSMGLRFFYVVDAMREDNDELASNLLSVVSPHGAWYWGHLLRATIAQRQGDSRAAHESIAKAFEDNSNLAGNLRDEVEKWFGDEKAQQIFLRAFDALDVQ